MSPHNESRIFTNHLYRLSKLLPQGMTYDKHHSNVIWRILFNDQFASVPEGQSICSKDDEERRAHSRSSKQAFTNSKLFGFNQILIVSVTHLTLDNKFRNLHQTPCKT